MATLTKSAILKYLKKDSLNALVITPLLDDKQISGASVDVRLGNQFIVFRMHALGVYNPYNRDSNARSFQERHIVNYGEKFVLHPGMLALGATFEYVSLPGDLEAQIEGRSSWARLGLQIATATTIEPHFKGVVTLELSNVGTVPLVLKPGVRIAQMVMRKAKPYLEEEYGEERKYKCPVGPEFSRIGADRDFWLYEETREEDGRVVAS